MGQGHYSLFYITPKIKSRQIAVQQHCWRLCGSTEADHSHIFWNCVKTRPYWENVNAAIENILGYKIPNTCPVKYLGHIKDIVKIEDTHLIKVLLAASKKAITRQWLNEKSPKQEQWLEIVRDIFNMEKLTHSLRVKEN